MKMKTMIAVFGVLFSAHALADVTNAEKLVYKYTNIAHSVNPTFQAPSITDGKIFFNRKFQTASGREAACASCHTNNPANVGKNIVTNKEIPPLAPRVNTKRFTDIDKVEEEFTKHCNDILGADCAPAEKANFIAYLLTETKPTK
ncbi:MAG TPA: cytochrome c'' [Methylophilus sp.]|nr:cytochrome c'' [Methylophilus sp.]